MFSNIQRQASTEGGRASFERQSRCLSDLDVVNFASAFASLHIAWKAEQFEDSDGEIFLLIAPMNSDDDLLNFSVRRLSAGWQLTAWRGDDYKMLGSFTRMQEAIGVVWKTIEAEQNNVQGFDAETFRRACEIIAHANI